MLRSIAPSGRPGGKISPGHNISAEDTYPRKCRIQHFLGLTHFCGETRNGRFIVKRKTQRKRMIRKLKQLRLEMRRRMHSRQARGGRPAIRGELQVLIGRMAAENRLWGRKRIQAELVR